MHKRAVFRLKHSNKRSNKALQPTFYSVPLPKAAEFDSLYWCARAQGEYMQIVTMAFYIAGSLCFLTGSVLSLIEILRG